MPFSRLPVKTGVMKQLCIAVGCVFALLVLRPAPIAGQDAAHSKSAVAIPKNSHEWKRLRASARTADDFHALSEWCVLQAELYRRKQADCEGELRDYYAKDRFNPPKPPGRDVALKNDIATYRERAKHWSELAGRYSAKATAAATPDNRR
jgi:hypothetical protein